MRKFVAQHNFRDTLRITMLITVSVDLTNVTHLQQQLRDVRTELDSERSAKLSLENKHRALTNDRELLTK